MNGFRLVYKNTGNGALFSDAYRIVNKTIKGDHYIHIQGGHVWNLTDGQMVRLQERICRYYKDFILIADREDTEYPLTAE